MDHAVLSHFGQRSVVKALLSIVNRDQSSFGMDVPLVAVSACRPSWMLPVPCFSSGLARGELFRCQHDNVVRDRAAAPTRGTAETSQLDVEIVANGFLLLDTIIRTRRPRTPPVSSLYVPPSLDLQSSPQQLVVP